MKNAILLFALLACFAACAKKQKRTAETPVDDRFARRLSDAARGRAEFVSTAALLSDPAKYHMKRVILAGIWTEGFEHSQLNFEGNARQFWIWVEADWSKIDEPFGDFSRRKDASSELRPDEKGYRSHRILAEGTFCYRKLDFKAGITGYGHMGVSEGYFIMDRLFQFDPAN